MLFALIVDDGDRDALALVVACTRLRVGHECRALRRTVFEQLDDTRETVRDVLTPHTTGVEGTHGQLSTGLADRLGGDDADGLAELDRLARCQ